MSNKKKSDAKPVEGKEVPMKMEHEKVEVAPVQEAAEAIVEEAKYSFKEWNTLCVPKLGVARYALCGAMANEDLDGFYSESEIRTLVEKFLKRPAR